MSNLFVQIVKGAFEVVHVRSDHHVVFANTWRLPQDTDSFLQSPATNTFGDAGNFDNIFIGAFDKTVPNLAAHIQTVF